MHLHLDARCLVGIGIQFQEPLQHSYARCRIVCSLVHDLLVLDEADLRFMTRETAIGFLDFDEDCTLSVRFTSFTLSAGVRKILISNPEAKTLYPEDKSGAIDRRLTVRHVTHRLYIPRLPLQQQQRSQRRQHSRLL